MYQIPAILPDSEIRSMQGAAISLGIKNIPVICLGDNENCLTFRSGLISQRVLSPSTKQGKVFIDFLIKNVQRGVLFPSNDRCVLLFSEYRDVLENEGFLISIPSEETLISGFDKWLCNQVASGLNIPCANTKLITCDNDIEIIKGELSYPLIIKGTRLAGGNYIKVNSENEIYIAYEKMKKIINLPENLMLNPNLIAQEWLNYDMEDIWCVESYYDKLNNPSGFLSIKKIRTVIYKDGSFGSRLYSGECIENKDVISLSKRLLDSLGWVGFAHLDWVYIRQEDKFYLMEINPRLPGFSFLTYKSGFDMPFCYYSELIGQKLDRNYIIKPSLYFEMFRYPGDISSALSSIIRKQYSLKRFLKSYLRILFERKKVIIDLFCIKDFKITYFNLKSIISDLFSDFFKRKK